MDALRGEYFAVLAPVAWRYPTYVVPPLALALCHARPLVYFLQNYPIPSSPIFTSKNVVFVLFFNFFVALTIFSGKFQVFHKLIFALASMGYVFDALKVSVQNIVNSSRTSGLFSRNSSCLSSFLTFLH